MTGFVKINPNHTGTEIYFIGKHYSLTLVLARTALHMAIYGQVCFHRWPFVIPVRSTRCTTDSLGPVNDINKDMSGTRLLPTTVSTYPVDWVCFCHLLKTQHCCLCPSGRYTRLRLPTCLHHPPTSYNMPSVILQLLWKMALKTQHC